MKKQLETKKMLDDFNNAYASLHKKYEDYFWTSHMGNHLVDKKMNEAFNAKIAFSANPKNLNKVNETLKIAGKNNKQKLNKKLLAWKKFFEKYQTPKTAIEIQKQITEIESKIHKKIASREEGYIDPKSKKFVKASIGKMRLMQRTHANELIRKACFIALEKLAIDCLEEYVELARLRNQFAKALGFEDYYAYRIYNDEGLSKKELFKIFNKIFEKTKYAFKNIRKLEHKMPGLRKPWNFAYMMSGDFTKEEDPYFQFDEALIRWGKSFAAMNINFSGGTLQLDLLDRPKKYHNGFCHWPDVVRYKNGKKLPGSANFTSNAIYGQIGSGILSINTLFHEGGHAAHLLNSKQTETCLNHEYPPTSTAWSETQSMFLEMHSFIEWKMRYAKNSDGAAYPFGLFERKVRKLNILSPLSLMPILFVCNFEKEIYEAKKLTAKKVIETAKKNYKKYFDFSEDSLTALNIPHIYSRQGYEGYGLAKLALEQWRDYFYKKYGYIVDNPNIGKEMKKVWELAASRTFKEFVVLATGKKLSAKSFIKNATRNAKNTIAIAKRKLKKMKEIPEFAQKINLNAKIKMVNGKKIICDNGKSFENMCEKYKFWLRTKKIL